MNSKLDLIKKLLPGFLPLLVFIVVDAISNDMRISIAVAVTFGIGEFIYTYIRTKILDKFILFDTSLLIAMGLISYLYNDEVFFKIKPAIIEFLFCIVLGISAFSQNNIMLKMTKRYMKGLEMNNEQIIQMIRSLKILFWIFIFHTALTAYSAFFMSKAAWLFISGGLFYILFGAYFVYELIRRRIINKNYEKEEWLPMVNDEGETIGRIPRSVAHQLPVKRHPVVHLQVINSKNEIYLQKRPQHKLIQPGKWDTAVGGHVCYDEDIHLALKREAKEEIGIADFKYDFISKYLWDTPVEAELVFMFVTRYDGKMEINKQELDKAAFWSVDSIKSQLGKEVFTPNFEKEFIILLEAGLE